MSVDRSDEAQYKAYRLKVKKRLRQVSHAYVTARCCCCSATPRFFLQNSRPYLVVCVVVPNSIDQCFVVKNANPDLAVFAPQGYQEQLDALKDDKAEQLKLLGHLYGELEVRDRVTFMFLSVSCTPRILARSHTTRMFTAARCYRREQSSRGQVPYHIHMIIFQSLARGRCCPARPHVSVEQSGS